LIAIDVIDRISSIEDRSQRCEAIMSVHQMETSDVRMIYLKLSNVSKRIVSSAVVQGSIL